MRTLIRIARFGLGPDADPTAVPNGDWPALLEAIVSQRLGGHAVRCAEAGVVTLSSQQWDELLTRHEEQLAVDLRIERMLVECDELLEREGIETRILKGPALAHRFYDDPALRSFGDGDLLVRGPEMDHTIDVLQKVGLHRRFTAPRASFDQRFVKAVALVRDDGLELDLHRALTPGPFGVLLDVDEIFRAPPATVRIADRDMGCLAPEFALVHACAHAVLGDAVPRFVPVRDIAQILRSEIDANRVIDVFERFQAPVVAQRAVALVEQLLEVLLDDPIANWARAVPTSRTDRWRLRSYVGDKNRYARQAAAMFWVLPTLRDRAAYASALAFPDRAYLEDRDESYRRRFARSTALVLRGRPR
jgi:hypothetical protein